LAAVFKFYRVLISP